jgi:hypothetical protein
MIRICLDVESTIADIYTPFAQQYEEEYGEKPEEHTEWGFGDSNVDIDEFMEMTSSNWKHRALDIPPEEDDLMLYANILDSLADVLDIVTGRRGFEDEIRNWLDYNGLAYNRFYEVSSQKKKADFGYDVIIDDCPKHVESINADQTLLLYDQPYNRNLNLPDNVFRIESIKEAAEHVSGME